MQSYRIQNYEMNFTIFYNLHSRLICIRASADRRVLKSFQFIWIWHWTMSDSLLVIKIPLHFRSAASRRAREDAPWEEQGTGTFSQASTIRHRWSDDGNWGQYYVLCHTAIPKTPCLLITCNERRWWNIIGIEQNSIPNVQIQRLVNGRSGGNNMVTRRQWDTWSGDNNWGSANQDQIIPAIFMTVMTPPNILSDAVSCWLRLVCH